MAGNQSVQNDPDNEYTVQVSSVQVYSVWFYSVGTYSGLNYHLDIFDFFDIFDSLILSSLIV